jgi:hypothetical protein
LRLRGLKEGNYQVEILDPYLKTVATSNEDYEEDAEVVQQVPQGGMVKLVKTEANQIPSDNLGEIFQQLRARAIQ